MNTLFYISSAVTVLATLMAITRLNAVHALLYLIVSLLAAALVLFGLGAPFVAALEVIIYAGAIMVLFVFVVMLLNLGPHSAEQERRWLTPSAWGGPSLLALILLLELIPVFATSSAPLGNAAVADARQVGIALFGPYVLAVELSSLLLLAGLVGAYHLGRHEAPAGDGSSEHDERCGAP